MNRRKIIITFFVLLVLLILFYFITDRITRHTGFFTLELLEVFIPENIDLCLNKNEITLFINEKDFADERAILLTQAYGEYMSVFNCARNNDVCTRQGITVFPTLIINGKLFKGAIDSKTLLKETNCLS
ncbi:MAG: hypothetical protein AABX16_04915 [Nanoarchaeota archaeon]